MHQLLQVCPFACFSCVLLHESVFVSYTKEYPVKANIKPLRVISFCLNAVWMALGLDTQHVSLC